MEFPREIQNMILSKLDIDTRRSLGVFTRLKIPETLAQQIQECLKIPKPNKIIGHFVSEYREYRIELQITPMKFYAIIHTTNNEGVCYYVLQYHSGILDGVKISYFGFKTSEILEYPPDNFA